MKLTAILTALLLATPALAINTKPETPQKEAPKEKPAPERRSAPEPKAEPETRSSREPERENECPYTRTKANNWQCVATVRPRARPVTNQTIPAGELK